VRACERHASGCGGLRPLYCISAFSHISAFPYQMWKCSNAAMLYCFTQKLSNALLLCTVCLTAPLHNLLCCFSLLYCISAFPHYCTAFLHFNIFLLLYTKMQQCFTALHSALLLYTLLCCFTLCFTALHSALLLYTLLYCFTLCFTLYSAVLHCFYAEM
jgi:hypothetical protein